MSVAAITGALAARAFRFATEGDLQAGIAEALTADGVAFEREVALGPRDRIDFMVGDIGLEVKIGGPLSRLTEQLLRYATHERVRTIVLVTAQYRLGNLPGEILGKPVTVITLPRAFA